MSSICQHISVMNDDFIVSFFIYIRCKACLEPSKED